MLQTRTVEPGTLGLLKKLMNIQEIDHFYLVGGTALALQIGHRTSVDLDLFTSETFDTEALLQVLHNHFDLNVEVERKNMVVTYINSIKVDFVKMGYPVLFDPLSIEGVRMLDIRDIAPMKLKAIVQRGSKKDFFDIYCLLETMSIEEIIELFKNKFKQQEVFHVIKSLTYFDDAELFPDPQMFDKKLSWSIVKQSITEAVKRLF